MSETHQQHIERWSNFRYKNAKDWQRLRKDAWTVNLPAKQPLRVWREHQISDISHFWVNDVTLIKLPKIANRKFHDLFQFWRGIDWKIYR
jgi:hypothetical protein